jgi:Zn-dependent protease with chaperone function
MKAEDTDLSGLVDAPAPRPFLDFFVQGGIALALLAALVYGIFRIGLMLGPLIPFAWEKQVSELALKDFPLTDSGPEAEARRATLQRLVDGLVPYEHLPPGMTVTVNYSQDDVVNAFSTLGGNIVIYEGLIRRLPSENALSMVLGHEIGHIKHRDPVRFMSGEQLVKLVISLATGDSGLAADVVSNMQRLTSLQFSREAEERADIAGLTALEGRYGHINGYRQTFDALESWIAEHGGHDAEPPEFLRDHPDTKIRIAKLEAYAASHGWSEKGPLTLLRQANYPTAGIDLSILPAASGLSAKTLPRERNQLDPGGGINTTKNLQPDNTGPPVRSSP